MGIINKGLSEEVRLTIDVAKKLEDMYNSFDDILVEYPDLTLYVRSQVSTIVFSFKLGSNGYERTWSIQEIKSHVDITPMVEFTKREVLNTLLKVGGVDVS